MKQALGTVCVLAILGVIGALTWPRPLPAVTNLRTVTLWWVIFNQPAFCRGGGPGSCTGRDLSNTEAEPALVWAAEQQVRPELPISLKATLPVTRQHRPTDAGLTNPHGAEVHLALLTHRVLTPVHQRARLVAALSGACAQTTCAPFQQAIHQADAGNAHGHSTSEIWRVAAGAYVPLRGSSTLWRSSQGLMGTLYTRVEGE
jgi:hypothetical protein